MVERKGITLTLTGWQKRMVADHVSRQASPSKVMISVIDRRQWVMYRQPIANAVARGAWNLYLTDAQIARVAKAIGGAEISALTVSKDAIASGDIAFR